ncbi:Anti-sigma regulatory factor (Ser/Thr protein kinase), essential for photomixotrophic growth, PmgA [uncultured Synechococcales cyanobacterium]|uniref:Anti-sigma regulatory factor (Ser/Thr protein kinase), essential for photomixotrophic growth, PmgA n=1 Tax=uncultured Synechococcales cyanobacterium TaxID=1936017 RepID=A0A6J4VVD9_9CYAN|nr:Anti-sigma regulatory factor (Ser/Thr protein kinase), essential for photomixotrophic growth, PmgA [uncultured Synechococcales cyanobacterium]
MVATSLRPTSRSWTSISFSSTLYLHPVLDLLLAEVPPHCHAELRLGLQEALVNAAKHGNELDPNKLVLVHFTVVRHQYWWIISDQGSGFVTPGRCSASPKKLPQADCECGRGLYILYQIFDRVYWNAKGTALRLCKSVSDRSQTPVH